MENMQQSQVPVGESQFTGGLLGLIGINILQGLLIAFTLGCGAPWAICMKERWENGPMNFSMVKSSECGF